MANIIHTTLTFQAGNTYTLYIPTTLANDGGYTAYKDNDITFNGESRTNNNGFWVENLEVGNIVKKYEDKVAVDYKHILPASNIIWFYAYTGERVRMSVTSIVVHDHRSISQGGPAYGTYFSYVDDTTTDGGGNN